MVYDLYVDLIDKCNTGICTWADLGPPEGGAKGFGP